MSQTSFHLSRFFVSLHVVRCAGPPLSGSCRRCISGLRSDPPLSGSVPEPLLAPHSHSQRAAVVAVSVAGLPRVAGRRRPSAAPIMFCLLCIDQGVRVCKDRIGGDLICKLKNYLSDFTKLIDHHPWRRNVGCAGRGSLASACCRCACARRVGGLSKEDSKAPRAASRTRSRSARQAQTRADTRMPLVRPAIVADRQRPIHLRQMPVRQTMNIFFLF